MEKCEDCGNDLTKAHELEPIKVNGREVKLCCMCGPGSQKWQEAEAEAAASAQHLRS